MEDSAADADDPHRQQGQSLRACESEQHQADEREGHAGGQDEIQRPLVEAHSDQRLKERGGELKNESNKADLKEAQRESLPENRVKRRRERLHHVVEHMRGAERDQDANRRRLHPPTARRGGISVSLRSRQGSVPEPRVPIRRRPKKFRPPKIAALCQVWANYDRSSPSLSIRRRLFPVGDVQKGVTRATSAREPWSSGGLPSTARPLPWRLAPFRP